VDSIEIIVEVSLNYPYDESLSFLINLVRARGMFLLKCDTASSKAEIAIPSKIFKVLVGKNPKINMETIIRGTEQYIKKIRVVDIKIRKENKSGENSKPK